MKRLFIAITINQDLQQQLLGAREFFPNLPGARWLAPENLHLTLIFLGEVQKELLPQIKAVLAGQKSQSFALQLEKITFGPPGRRPRMVWAVFQPEEKLTALRNQLGQSLRRAGIKFQEENRSLLPHITLCRFEGRGERREIKLSGSLPVTTICLMESKLKKEGAEYYLIEACYLTQR